MAIFSWHNLSYKKSIPPRPYLKSFCAQWRSAESSVLFFFLYIVFKKTNLLSGWETEVYLVERGWWLFWQKRWEENPEIQKPLGDGSCLHPLGWYMYSSDTLDIQKLFCIGIAKVVHSNTLNVVRRKQCCPFSDFLFLFVLHWNDARSPWCFSSIVSENNHSFVISLVFFFCLLSS